ncbi:MAG: hypothetical protein R3Y11_06805 [Pseudomonadota bacterium]
MFKGVQYQKYNHTFQELFNAFPYLPNRLESWLGKSIGELSHAFTQPTPFTLSTTAQNALASMVTPVMGNAVAHKLVQSLEASSRIMATHHLGIDCLAEQVQALHFLELQKLLQTPEIITTIPVLACAGVPMQSYSYPRGLMLGRKSAQGHPIRYPLFPSAKQNTLVLAAPALHKNGVLKIVNKWDASLVSAHEWQVMQSIVHDIILHDDCLGLANFSQQAMYINGKIFQAIYPDNPNTHAVYLNLEELATKLVLADLQDPSSVLSTLFFQKACRDRILEELTDTRACWSELAKSGQTLERTGKNGTIFFWAIDEQGRRIPLCLQENPDRLVYGDLSIALTAEDLSAALQQGLIYPSLYTAFVSLHLQHNLACCGGLYMTKYLPDMLETTASVLQNHCDILQFSTHCRLGSGVTSVKTLAEPPLSEPCSCGHSTSTHDTEHNNYIPSGSIEIIAHGGIKQEHLQAIANLIYDDMLPTHLAEWTFLHIPEIRKKQDMLNTFTLLSKNDSCIYL